MVTPARAERAVVWMLCRLLPAGFRARQQAEWSGDLVALSGGGAGARWRYLLAAAWTLPALRAHAKKAGIDRPIAMVIPSPPVATLVRIVLVGLGLPVLSWLIAIPLRYVLLDVPARLESYSGMPFDPKDLWPMQGPLIVLVPVWIILSFGAYAIIFDWMLVTWIGLLVAVLGAAQRGVGWMHRVVSGLIGVTLVAGALTISRTYDLLMPFSARPALAAAALGGGAVIVGVSVRRVSLRKRVTMVLTGLTAIAIFAWHYTSVGMAMLSWFMD